MPVCLDEYLQVPASEPTLSLLRTCRQVYQEAALLPYTLNAFWIGDRPSMLAFVTQRTPAQLASVRHLKLVTYRMGGLFGDVRLDTPPLELTLWNLQRFTGLRIVSVRHLNCWGHEDMLKSECGGP
jgi:hypothetical protein